jgi:predicted transcriptional regulator
MQATSIRLSDEARAKLAALAEATGRSQSWLLHDAINRYLEDEAWQVQAIEEGLQDAEAGNLVTMSEDIEALLQRGWISAQDVRDPDPIALDEYRQANQ